MYYIHKYFLKRKKRTFSKENQIGKTFSMSSIYVAEKLNTMGVVMFSVNRVYKSTEKTPEGKFKLRMEKTNFPTSFKNINETNYKKFINKKWNGMAMRMGATYKNDVILGIDIDTDPSVKSFFFRQKLLNVPGCGCPALDLRIRRLKHFFYIVI